MCAGKLKRLFCSHDWEIMVNQRITLTGANNVAVGYEWVIVQRCKKCGKVQKNIIKA